MNTHKKTSLYVTAFSAVLFLAFGFWSGTTKATLDNYLNHTSQMNALSYGILAAKKTTTLDKISILKLKNSEFIKPLIAENFEHSKIDSSGGKWMVLTITNNEMYHMDYCRWLIAHQDIVLNSNMVLQSCGGGSVQLLFSNLIKEPSQFKHNESASKE